MKSAELFWDAIAEKYARKPVPNAAVYQQKIVHIKHHLTSESELLEFGCGTGSTALLLAPLVKSIIAADISSAMIAIARKKALQQHTSNVCFSHCTLEQAVKGQQYDVVLGMNILHLVKDLDAEVSTAFRALKSGGVFITSTAILAGMNRFARLIIRLMQVLGKAPFIQFFTRDRLVSCLIDAGFTIEYEWLPDKTSLFLIAKKPKLQST